jgi:hypothetical protein
MLLVDDGDKVTPKNQDNEGGDSMALVPSQPWRGTTF